MPTGGGSGDRIAFSSAKRGGGSATARMANKLSTMKRGDSHVMPNGTTLRVQANPGGIKAGAKPDLVYAYKPGQSDGQYIGAGDVAAVSAVAIDNAIGRGR